MPIIYGNTPTGRRSNATQRLTPAQIEHDKLGMNARHVPANKPKVKDTTSNSETEKLKLTHKLCLHCKKLLPLDNFRRDRTRGTGRKSICKTCESKAESDRRKAKRNPHASASDKSKVCIKCGYELMLSVFINCPSQPDGRSNVCKFCADPVKSGNRVCVICGVELPKSKFKSKHLCKACFIKRQKETRYAKLQEMKADPNHELHGTAAGRNYGCDCEKCRKYNAAYLANRTRVKKEREAFYRAKED